MAPDRPSLRDRLGEYLGTRHPVYGWEKLALWVLLATCIGLDLSESSLREVVRESVSSARDWY